MSTVTTTDEVVELVIPADVRYLSSARVIAATVAVEVGFDVEELERVRIAINELTTVLIEELGEGGRVRLVIRPSARGDERGSLTVTGSALEEDGRGAVTPTLDELADRILTAVASHYEVSESAFSVTVEAGPRPTTAPSS